MAGCYNSGQAWATDGNKNAFHGAVRDLCRGTLSGWFDAPGKVPRCATLAASDCELRLTNEINGCNYGGESTVSDWFFK
jgi:hypothetical protein